MTTDNEAELRDRLVRYRQLLMTNADERTQMALHEAIAEIEATLDELEDDDDDEN
jgi:hypothetical protein